jgi:hypothetical protein
LHRDGFDCYGGAELIKVIPREEIPDWDFGSVCVKTWSIIDSLDISKIAGKEEGFENIDVKAAAVIQLAGGIHYIKNVNDDGFLLEPNKTRDEKIRFLDKMSTQAGSHILKAIVEINKPLTGTDIKNS